MSSPVTTRARSSSTQEEPSPSKIPKASWTDFTTKTLLELIIEEIYAGNRVGGTINPNGWRNIGHKFRLRTGQSYTKAQIKNRYSNLRKLYGKWRKLNDRATGLGVDPRTGALRAPDEWWEEMSQGDPEVLKWKTALPKFLDLMGDCFEGNVATGADTYYPSYCRGGGTFPIPPRPAPPVVQLGQVPHMNWGNVEVADSNLCPPIRTHSPSPGDSSRYKRTRAGTSKPSTGERMASSMEEYVAVGKKKNELLQTIITGSEDYQEVDQAMSMVQKIEGIDKNTSFYIEITKILRVKMNRYFFLKYIAELDHPRQIEWFKSFM